MNGPILDTERLRLRPFRPDDASDVQRLAGDAEIADTTLNIPHPYYHGVAEEWIASHGVGFEDGTFYSFAVVERVEGELVGTAGLKVDKRHNKAEIGYWIGRPFWNRGFATEAARAVVDFGFDELGLRRIEARHLVRNPASGRVMQKLGMAGEGVSRQSMRKGEVYEDLVHYAMLSEDR